MREIPLLPNATMDAIIWKSELTNNLTGDFIHHVYDRTAPKSPLRKLLVDWWVRWCNPTWLDEKYYGYYSKRFYLMRRLQRVSLGCEGARRSTDFGLRGQIVMWSLLKMLKSLSKMNWWSGLGRAREQHVLLCLPTERSRENRFMSSSEYIEVFEGPFQGAIPLCLG